MLHAPNRRLILRALLPFLFLLHVPPLAVAFTLSGSVVGLSGEGVAGATVWMCQDRDVRRTETDVKGAFRFSEVAPRPTEVVARKEGLAVGGADAHAVASGPVKVVLGESDVLLLCVKNAESEPVAGARIRAMFVNDAFNVPFEDLAEAGLPDARSDDDGLLVIPDLPKDGHARFVVSHRHYAATHVAYLPVGGKRQTILLYPGVALRGRVTAEDGEGIERASVTAFRVGVGGRRGLGEALTDPEGFYHMVAPPGEYYVGVRHPRHASPEPEPVSLKAGSEENVVDVAMSPAHVIEGSVVYPDEKPCGAVSVSYWIKGALYEETLTQQDGRFRLQAPDREGRVRVAPPNGYMTESLEDIPVEGKLDKHITLSPTKLKRLPAIEGMVLGEDNSPQPNVLIASLDLDPKVWVITDDGGRFFIQLDWMPSKAKASFRAEHALRFLRRDFKVAWKKTGRVRVKLERFDPDLTEKAPLADENDLSALVGEPAPEIECDAWFNSSPLKLESLRGKVVALTFWGGFDTRDVARDRIEELRALHDLYSGVDDVVIVSVHDGSKDPDEIERYVENRAIQFPVGRDADPFKTFERYNARYIPQTVLIDKQGTLRFYQVDGRLVELIKHLRRLG